MTTLGWSS